MAWGFTDKELEIIEAHREVCIDDDGYWLQYEQERLKEKCEALGLWVDDHHPADFDIVRPKEPGDEPACYAALDPDYGCAVCTLENWRTLFDNLFAEYDEFSEPASEALGSAAYREWVVEVGGEYGDEQPRRVRRRFVLHGSDDVIPAADMEAGWTVDNISTCLEDSINAVLDEFEYFAVDTYNYLTTDSHVWEHLCENGLLDDEDLEDDEEENDDECEG